MRLGQMKRTVTRHLMMRSYAAYEQVLQAIKARGDIWMTSQGEYMRWWERRANARLTITVADGKCTVDSSLEDAVFEKFPGEFLSIPVVPCEGDSFSGEVCLTIDDALEKKQLLIEVLKREGIPNFRVAGEGEFFISREEVAPLLAEMDAKLHKRCRLFEADIAVLRQTVIDKLAQRGVPLLRIWYHPRIDGAIVRAVFSPRYDVDRAIDNLARIRKLEQKYGVTSTIYLRAFCPFYSDRDVEALASSAWCTEIGLHGEFTRNSRTFGDEFSAARAEKEYLERLIGQPVLGVCMHGGELHSNVSQNTWDAIERANFLYDTTQMLGCNFPFKRAVDGRLRNVYCFNHTFGDIKVPPTRNYGGEFYSKVMEKMNEVYEQSGVFVLVLHPVYFGFYSYLLRPKNLARLLRFFWSSRRRACDE